MPPPAVYLAMVLATLVQIHAGNAPLNAKRMKTGARVKRGPDWVWHDQDGRGKGTVIDIRAWQEEPDAGVRVQWDSGEWNLYRWGADNGTRWDLEILDGEFVDGFEWQEPVPVSDACGTTERQALLDLYHATDGPSSWRFVDGWKDGIKSNPCKDGWEGVTCKDGKVFALRLDNNRLKGTVPDSIGVLTDLVTLDLSMNELSGKIPDALASLSNLEFLELKQNKLTGAIPSSFRWCTKLSWVSLARNRLEGPIPSELGDLSHLEYFFANDNNLQGRVPKELVSLRSLARNHPMLNGNDGLAGVG